MVIYASVLWFMFSFTKWCSAIKMNSSRSKLIVELALRGDSSTQRDIQYQVNNVRGIAVNANSLDVEDNIRYQQVNENNIGLDYSYSEKEQDVIENDETSVPHETYIDSDGYDSDKDPEFVPSPVPSSNTEHMDELFETSDNESKKNSTVKGRPKKGRKRKLMDISKDENKRNRNCNKSHYNYKGKKVKRKPFTNYKCSCLMKCYSKVPENMRREQFDKYWELGNYDAQTACIGSLVHEAKKKRVCGSGKRARQFTRKYTFNSMEVCRETFIKTLGISTKRVDTSLKKLRSLSIIDKRGKQQGGKNKLPEEKRQEIMNQINKIPKYKSHYRREQSSDAEFLPPEMTLSKMYNMYKQEVESPVSFSSYRHVFFSNFNLKFKSLKKDTCNTCDTYQAKIKASNETEQDRLINEHNDHIEKWQGARKKMKEDMEMASTQNSLECITFDLEKTLPLPRIPTNIIFYKRQIWLYNLGVHSATTNKGFCYVWVESQAVRGAQEVASCLLKHINKHVSSNTKELILWADSCGGQNRNIKLTLMMKAVLKSHPSLQKIYIRFLISGHSFLPNDSDFSDIECALKHHQRIYLPEDYIHVMTTCRKKNKFDVTKMTSDDFYGTEEIENKITNRKVDVDKAKISWMETREVMVDKSFPYSIFLKNAFEQEHYSEINIRKRQVGRPAVQFRNSLIHLWPDGKKISNPKLEDIRSVMHLIPFDAQQFYQNLVGDEELIDDVDGFSGDLDFDIE